MKKERDFLKTGLILVCLFFIIGLLVKTNFFSEIDKYVYNYFLGYQTPLGISVMQGISLLASPVFVILFILVLLLSLLFVKTEVYKKYSVFILLNIAVSFILEEMFKFILKIARPLSPFETGYSFPSGHAVVSFALYGSLALCFNKEKTTIYFLIIPLLISLSRLFLGVHWLSDVLGGAVLGLSILLINKSILKKYLSP